MYILDFLILNFLIAILEVESVKGHMLKNL